MRITPTAALASHAHPSFGGTRLETGPTMIRRGAQVDALPTATGLADAAGWLALRLDAPPLEANLVRATRCIAGPAMIHIGLEVGAMILRAAALLGFTRRIAAHVVARSSAAGLRRAAGFVAGTTMTNVSQWIDTP